MPARFLSKPLRRRLLISTLLAGVVGTGLAVSYRAGLFSTAQIRSTDFLLASRTGEQAAATVIVGIDQRSYRELLPTYGAMVNWPRTLYAQAVEALGRAGARVIAFDLFFDAPRQEDPGLASAIRTADIVVTPVEAQGPRETTPPPGIAQLFDVFVRPTAQIAQAAAAEGFVNVTTDPDTVVRSLPLLLQSGDATIPALALTAVARYIRRTTVMDEPATADVVYAAGRAIPLLDSGSMVINYLGPPSVPGRDGPFTILSFHDVMRGAFDPAVVKDKIVLIGLTVRGLDEFATPTTSTTRMWGVEVLGNAIETILSQRYLAPASPILTIGLVFGYALLSAWLVAVIGPWLAAAGMAGLLLVYFAAASFAFDGGLLLNLVYPTSSLLLAFAVATIHRIGFEQAQQRLVRAVMARYLSPTVSQWVLRDPELLNLGGETRTMTVLFCDLRGFTTLSHSLAPPTLVALLNEYMTAMTQVVFARDGVLDKYIGDAIMAFWNAPIDQPDHARRACDTALAMVKRVEQLRTEWAQRGVPPLDLGIGINTGPMVVGNLGSKDRLTYTVLGDAVNVASRLEGLNKEYGTRIVLGERTKHTAGDALGYRYLDLVSVKGRHEPLTVYELVGPADRLDAAKRTMLNRYHHGIAQYRARRWQEAADVFRSLQDSCPDDGPTALYLQRSTEFLRNPPPPTWDGVFVASSK